VIDTPRTLALAKTIYDTCNIKGVFKLRSGQTSNEYFDKYQLEARPELLKAIADGMSELLPVDTRVLAGLEMGGIPVAAAVSLATSLPCVFVRKKAKEYGTCKIAEGVDFKGLKVTVIEDVVTTGGAIVDGVRALREGGAVVDTVLCVIDREQGGAAKLEQIGLTLKPLFTASQLRRAAGVS
jgi:orotate phosphoribosyltransferase